MLAVVNKPLLQYAVDEAVDAGIEQFIFVVGRGKNAIEEHFDIAFELEATQAARGKDLSALVGTRFSPGEAVFIRQQEPFGLGHAIWCARHVIGQEPFAVVLPDEFLHGKPDCLAQMMNAYDEVGGNIVSVLEVPPDATSSYGVIVPGAPRGALIEINGMVKKPAPGPHRRIPFCRATICCSLRFSSGSKGRRVVRVGRSNSQTPWLRSLGTETFMVSNLTVSGSTVDQSPVLSRPIS